MENDLEIFRIGSPAVGVGIALSEVLEYHKEQPVLLMLAGGSAFSVLDYIEDNVLGPNLTLSVLDERCSSDPKVNNFLQLKETGFFKKAVAKGAEVISTAVEKKEECSDLAKSWEKALRDWKDKNPEGLIIATMGIGSDGHVAGIFPDVDEEKFSGEELVISYSVAPEVNKFTDRVTMTYAFLKEYLDGAIVYAVGEEKKEIIKTLEEDEEDDSLTEVKTTKEIPAMILKQMKLISLYTEI